MNMQFFFFDADEQVIGMLENAETCRVNEGAYTAELEFPAAVPFAWSDCYHVAFEDINGDLALFEIKDYKASSSNGLATVKLSAESAAMAELLDEVITGKAVSGAQAGYATQRAIEDTRWTLRSTETVETTITDLFYYTNVWAALNTIREVTGCAHYFGITVSNGVITGRYVSVKARAGASRGRTFDTGKDMTDFEITEDRSGVYTRLYGRGKGEEVGENEQGEATYGRRITFEEVAWSTATGDPVDKPLNQLYVEDTAATAMFGRGPTGHKRPRQNIVVFEDCEDPEELLSLTWEKLKSIRYPILRISGTFVDMERVWGYTHEAVRIGDDVQVIVREWNIAYQDYVENVIRDYVNPLNTKVFIGPEGQTSYSIQHKLSNEIEKVREKADIGSSVATANPGLLQGIIDTMVTAIMSTGTGISTDPVDGSLILTASDGNSVVKITGSGILIADSKTGNAWNWQTAIDGNGIVTELLTTGVLNASLIKILGTERFYWDAANIYIHDTTNTNKQIRIGQYDGTHYGIAFTTDGGLTWQSAIDFDGVHFSAQSIISTVLNSQQYQQAMAAKADADDLTGLEAIAITEVKPQYYLSNSATELQGDTWHDTAPTWQSGKYMWSRNYLTYADGDAEPTTAVCIAGAKGQDGTNGQDGDDGRSVVNVLMQYYKSFSATTMTGGQWSDTAPTWENGKYIWTRQLVYYSDDPLVGVASTPICTTGAKGTDGTNGVNSYTYIRYSPNSDGTDFTQYPQTDSLYIGLAVVSSNTAPSQKTAYTWSRYRGQDGTNGTNGTNGTDGVTYYTYIRYSEYSDGTGFVSTPTSATKYIGIVVTTLSTAPTAKASYTWSKYVGENGTNGQDGRDGTSVNILGSYNSLADLEAAHPTGSAGDAYIINGDLYVWDPTGGQAGTGAWMDVGQIQGPAGQDGQSQYMFVRYSTSADGSNMSPNPAAGSLYIGICITTSSTAPSSPSSYTWSRYVGENGTDGISAYMHVRYSANANGNPMTTVPGNTTRYIGICSNTSSTAPSSYTAYTWSRYVGENGDSVTAVTPYYKLSDYKDAPPATTPSTTSWSVVAPEVPYGKYLWCAYYIQFSDSTSNSFTAPFYVTGADELTQSATAPQSPVVGMLWLDVSTSPNVLRRYDGTNWTEISDYSGDIDEVYAYVDQTKADLLATTDNIQAYVEENTVAQSVYATFAQTVRNILQMDANGTTMLFQRITEEIRNIEETEGTHHAEILKYIRFEDGDIILGEEGNPTILRLENDVLGFWQNGKRVAYFNSGLLYVDNLEALTSLKLGSYSFYPNSAGGMSLKYIGT